MEYSKIIAVTGLPGLYELINSKSDGAIVRSLEDRTSKFVSSRVHNFSHLESIEVFTNRENTNLVEVLVAMEKSSEQLPDEKDAAALKAYFMKVYPELDFERVYSSDLKKMVKWFSVLKNNQIELKITQAEAQEQPATPTPAEPAAKAEKAVKPAKKAEAAEAPAAEKEKAAPKARKAPAKKAEAPEAADAEAAKPKKAPARKKSEK